MIAVITGASGGMGAEFCRAFDKRGLDCIWLVSRDIGRLEEVASGLRTPSFIIPADLSTEDGLDRVRAELIGRSPSIHALVNCAGVGRFGDTWEVPAEETSAMIDLNIKALVEMSRMCVPYMAEGSTMVQLCSASAYLSLEKLNVYASTKAFVKSFCGGLRRELSGRGVNVLEVSPGWVDTGFISVARSGSSVPDKVFKHRLSKERVVERAMADMDARRARSVPGAYCRLQVFLSTHLRSLTEQVWSRMLRRFRTSFPGWQPDPSFR